MNPIIKKIPSQQLMLILIICFLAGILGFQVYTHYFYNGILTGVYQVDVEWMGHTDQKVVAFTFDDGPDPAFTPEILAVLDRYKTPATFFVCGGAARKYPEILINEVHAGHEIGNHTYSHPHLLKETPEVIRKELESADQVIQKITGEKPIYVRSPYEELSESILTENRNLKKMTILSTITLERQTLKTPQAQAERVVSLVFPGAIILMHDGRLNRHQTVLALPYLIEQLHAKGYQIVPLRKILKRR